MPALGSIVVVNSILRKALDLVLRWRMWIFFSDPIKPHLENTRVKTVVSNSG